MKNRSKVTKDELSREIALDLIGPVVHRWLLGLEQYFSYFDSSTTRFLYCARAGVRIRELYELYLAERRRPNPTHADMLWASRLALCKGLYGRAPDRALSIITREYAHATLADALKGLLRHHEELCKHVDWTAEEFATPAVRLPQWLKDDSFLARQVQSYLAQSSTAFESELTRMVGNASQVVLIDSGWQGTGQSLFHHAYPQLAWSGLYIGRILSPSHDPSVVDRIIGLLFEADAYDPQKPETAFVLHRHLFEMMLEPNGPSIEEIVGGPCHEAAVRQIAENENAVVSEEHDSLYLHVCQYLRSNAAIGPAEIVARHQAAMPQLARLLVQPTREEALALYSKDRSADFGKDLHVSVLITEVEEQLASGDKQASPARLNRDERIQQSLWPQGQIALEFEGKLCAELQARAAGLSDDLHYFDSRDDQNPLSEIEQGPALPSGPTVAIVTRTKNRPLLLRRAAESVAAQSHPAYLWVVVNDGGDEEVVREVIQRCAVDRRRIRLLSNEKSLGMEAASNLGIRHVESDYILIHDDDDSLHPDFLKETVGFLESHAGQRYGGVVTSSEYVSEEIRGDEVIVHSRRPYMDWVRNIQLGELMAQNLFAPIAFVYRRTLYDEIGGYNEELPVLGDWFFNLEFVMKTDIKVLHRPLAYYHHRDRGDSSRSGVYSNSVIGGQSKHEEFAAVCRNMFARKYGQNSLLASTALVGYLAHDLRERIDQQGSKLDALSNAADAADGTKFELDRLWVLNQILLSQLKRPGLLAKRAPQVKLDAPLVELVHFALRRKIRMSIPPTFNEEAYLNQNPDVAASVAAGGFSTGYEHYVLNGHRENRPRPNK